MTTRIAVALAALCVSSAALAGPPDPIASVRLESGGVISMQPTSSTSLAGPIATQRIGLTIANAGDVQAEARVSLTMPLDAVIGRLALNVEGQWMEGEVMPSAVATRFYEGIVRPSVGWPRDPALLVPLGGGRWSLSVFPIPPRGVREVEIIVHRVVLAKPGAARVERVPPTVEGGGRTFAVVPRFEGGPHGALPQRIIVALDTSLSVGRAGLLRGQEIVRQLMALHPQVDVVHGDRVVGRCGHNAACIAALTVGGASDLGALIDEAIAVAGTEPTAIVLVSDGIPTSGPKLAELIEHVRRRVGERPVALHTVAVGQALDASLGPLAERGLGYREPDLNRLVATARRPRYVVEGASDVELVPFGSDVVAVGRAGDEPLRFAITRIDDVGPTRAKVDIDAKASIGFAVARTYGALAVARAPKDEAGRLARVWGIAADGVGMLALEKDADYTSRGIARYKAAERAIELGLPAVVIDEATRNSWAASFTAASALRLRGLDARPRQQRAVAAVNEAFCGAIPTTS